MRRKHDDPVATRPPQRASAAGFATLDELRRTSADAAGDGPQHDAFALPQGMRLGEFEIVRKIGQGGFSLVYLAWDHSLERQVALKEYMPASIAVRSDTTQIAPRSERDRDTFDAGLKSFVNEGRLLAQFDLAALVKVYRFWEANGTAYMVMPFYQGRTVRDIVRGMPSPPTQEWLVQLIWPLMEVLDVMHAARCYHRDIAPDNILVLDESGLPLLLDFGAARRVVSDLTQSLTVVLKPGYAPLEQYGDTPGMVQGPWTDVYALAAVLYWAISGKPPVTPVARVVGGAFGPAAALGGGRYAAPFLQAIDRALALRPEHRTPSIDAFRSDLMRGTAATGDRSSSSAGLRVQGDDDPEATRLFRSVSYASRSTAGAGSAAVRPRRRGLAVIASAAVVVATGMVIWRVVPRSGPDAIPGPSRAVEPRVLASPPAPTSLAAPTARPALVPSPALPSPPPAVTDKPAGSRVPQATVPAPTREHAAASLPSATPRVPESRTEPPPRQAARTQSPECAKVMERIAVGETPSAELLARCR